MSKRLEEIPIFAEAPQKPAVGAPCNGCGVCCLLEPCPLGVMLYGHRQGPCRALRWDADALLYRCGAITLPREVLSERLPAFLQPVMPLLGSALGAMAGRWVAAGKGCDCDAELAGDVPPSA